MIFLLAVAITTGFQLLRSGDGQAPARQPAMESGSSQGQALAADGKKLLASVAGLRGDAGGGAALGLLSSPRRAVMRGVTLGLHNADPANPYEKYIDEIGDMGANTINFVVAAYQENASSSSLFVDGRKTPPDARVRELIAYARSKGFQVIVMPILLLENPRTGEWRGKISPTDWDAWWQRYYDYVLQYARLAQEAKADLFIVGSELVSTEEQTDRWRTLIKQVRQRFSGLLSYSANWDHYETPEFWSDLDIVGMTTYHDMNTPKHPALGQLVEAWKPIKSKILAWREKIGLSIVFTEVGWPNQVTCANQPWNYYGAVDEPDPQTQANCFEAFFQTWMDEPNVAGILVWEWRNNPGMVGGPEDTSYLLCGKPAEEVLHRYFKGQGQPRPRASSPGEDDRTLVSK
jgi:hypothetical protein